MRVRIAASLLLLAVSLTITGCNGSKETDEVSYVLAIGIDAADNNQQQYTFEIAIPRTLAGESGGKVDPKKSTEIVTITAPTLMEANGLLNSTVSRAPNLSHVTAFIIGENMAKQGLRDFLGSAMRYREFRGSMYMMVVSGTAKEFIKKNMPEEVLASRWMEAMMSTGTETGYYVRSTLHEFYTRLKNGNGSPYAVYMGLNNLKGREEPSSPSSSADVGHKYLPLGMPREGGNPATVIGTAIFKKDKMVGRLSDRETRMLAILLGEFPKGFISVEDPVQPQTHVSVKMRLGRETRIAPELVNGQVAIHINVFLEGEIVSIPSGVYYASSKYKQLLEQQISQVVQQNMLQMLQYTQEVGADVVDLSYYLRPKIATDQEFDKLPWEELYCHAMFDVKVTTKLRREGLMRKTVAIGAEGE